MIYLVKLGVNVQVAKLIHPGDQRPWVNLPSHFQLRQESAGVRLRDEPTGFSN